VNWGNFLGIRLSFLEKVLGTAQKTFVITKHRVNASVNCSLSWNDSGEQHNGNELPIEYVSSDSDVGMPCGKIAVAKCADCGAAICSDCCVECWGQSFCAAFPKLPTIRAEGLRPRYDASLQSNPCHRV